MITQREFFNSMAEKWDTVCRHDTGKIEYILSLLDIRNGDKILDVGTGTGVLIPFLIAKTGEQGEITAVDVSEKMLEMAKRKYSYGNVAFICTDALNGELPQEYFDFVVCYSVFPHFDDKQSAAAVMSKYLKKGGKFIICHSESRETINNMHKNASEAVSEDNLPDADILAELIERAGMTVLHKIDNEEMFVVIAQK